MKRAIWILFSAVVAVLLWQAVIILSGVPPFILPSPAQVATSLFSSRELIAWHASVTITEVLVGLVLGSVLGILTAIQLMMSATLRRLMLPILVFSQAVPVFALAPILTLWFGYGIWSKIVMAILIIYFPVTSNFLDGLRRTDKGYLDLAQSMNATPGRVLWHIRIPAALPSLGSGLKLAAVYAPIGAIIGEWVGASNGLGYLMLLANGRAKIDLMFASLFVLAAFTVLLHAAVSKFASVLFNWANGYSDR